MSPVVKMIWSQGQDRVIGKNNEIPWSINEATLYFETMTDGCAVIMGKNTWSSLPEKNRPLPRSRNIVLSGNPDSFTHAGAEVFPNLEKALDALADEKVVWIIGGADVYASAMPFASEIHVTNVRMEVQDADAFAPRLPRTFKLSAKTKPQTSKNGIRFSFKVYSRQ